MRKGKKVKAAKPKYGPRDLPHMYTRCTMDKDPRVAAQALLDELDENSGSFVLVVSFQEEGYEATLTTEDV